MPLGGLFSRGNKSHSSRGLKTTTTNTYNNGEEQQEQQQEQQLSLEKTVAEQTATGCGCDTQSRRDNNNSNNNNISTTKEKKAPSKAATTTTTTTTALPSASRPLLSWREAHLETCVSQSALCASLQQVIDNGHPNLSDHPDDSQYSADVLVLWGERQVAFQEILKRFQEEEQLSLSSASFAAVQQQQPAPATPVTKSSSVFSRAASLVMMPFDILTSPFAGPRDEYDNVEVTLWEGDDEDNHVREITSAAIASAAAAAAIETADDYKTFESNSSTFRVDHNEAILNVSLTLQCLNFLKAWVQQGPPRILKLLDASVGAVSGPPSGSSSSTTFQHWIREHSSQAATVSTTTTTASNQQQQNHAMVAQLLSQLPANQVSFLLDVLVAAGVVQKIDRYAELGKPDLIVLPDYSTTKTTTSSSPTSVDVKVRLALFDLQEAMDHLHERIRVLEARSKAAVSAAKACQRQQGDTNNSGTKKRNKDVRAALYQIQLHKQFQQEIDSAYKHLTNLESQQQALRQAADTHRMQKAMEQTAETLKSIRLTKQRQQQTITTTTTAAANSVTAEEQPTWTTQELVDDLAEELERVREDNLALALPVDGGGGGGGGDYYDDLDEDALLQELAGYPDLDPEDDIDVDDLLEEMECLHVTTSAAAPRKLKPEAVPTAPPAKQQHPRLQLPPTPPPQRRQQQQQGTKPVPTKQPISTPPQQRRQQAPKTTTTNQTASTTPQPISTPPQQRRQQAPKPAATNQTTSTIPKQQRPSQGTEPLQQLPKLPVLAPSGTMAGTIPASIYGGGGGGSNTVKLPSNNNNKDNDNKQPKREEGKSSSTAVAPKERKLASAVCL